tara:strand:+ start:423 stop:593 length:171 start_codon:yes stop_codon:yes gene_type:complete
MYTSLPACEKVLIAYADAKANTEAMTTQLGRVTAIYSGAKGEAWAVCAKDNRGDKV